MNATMAEIPTEQINQMKANLKDHVAELRPFFDALVTVAKKETKYDKNGTLTSMSAEEVKRNVKIYLSLNPYERNKLIDNMLKDEEQLVSTVMIPDELYDKLMSEVMAMPPRKRKNFKSTLTDKNGAKTKLIYDGELKNYSAIRQKFVPVKSKSRVFKENVLIRANTKLGYDLLQGRDMDEIMEEAKAENHTGNHTGRINHHVKIPAPSTW